MPIQKPGSFIRDSALRFSPLPQGFLETRDIVSLLDHGCRDESCRPSDTSYRTSVRLSDDELGWLDCRCCDLRRGGWHGVSRSTLIRAVLQAVSDTPVSLWGVSNEEQLTEALRRGLGRD
jgi:hypothetical protein